MTAKVSRRTLLLAGIAAQTARFAAAKSRITKAKVTAITDEMARSQDDAVSLAGQYRLQWLELRNAPGGTREIASLPAPELKAYAAGLSAAKLRTSFLHVKTLTSGTLAAAEVLGARRVLLAAAEPGSLAQFRPAFEQAGVGLFTADAPELGSLRVRVDIWENRNWRAYFENLERGNFQGDISLATTPEKAEDSLKEILHFIGEL